MDHARLELLQPIVFIVLLTVMSVLETVMPLETNPRRLQHFRRNMGMTALNSLLNFGLRGVLLLAATWAQKSDVGLLSATELSFFTTAVLGVLVLDLSNYIMHRLKHHVPFFWRFHRVHHSDAHLDVSTGVRFHPGETLLSMVLQTVVIVAFGIPFWALILYFLVLTIMIQLGHSNVRWPLSFDRLMRRVLVSPYMHRTHHSRLQNETDTNFGDIFSFWDKIFGTYYDRRRYQDLKTGLDGYENRQTVLRLLQIPFEK